MTDGFQPSAVRGKSPRPAPSNHRESADDYHSVLLQSAKVRVIVCKDNLQWIIQRRAGSRYGAPRWDSVSYCTSKEAVIRLYRGLMGADSAKSWPELDCLPETIWRGR